MIYCYLVLTTLNHTIFLLDLQWNMAVRASGVLQRNESCKDRRIRSGGLVLVITLIPALIFLLQRFQLLLGETGHLFDQHKIKILLHHPASDFPLF